MVLGILVKTFKLVLHNCIYFITYYILLNTLFQQSATYHSYPFSWEKAS